MAIAAGIGVEGCNSAFSIGDGLTVESPIGVLFVFCSVMLKRIQGCEDSSLVAILLPDFRKVT